jgi:hypothetical protein
MGETMMRFRKVCALRYGMSGGHLAAGRAWSLNVQLSKSFGGDALPMIEPELGTICGT